MPYLYLKALHIIFVVTWFSGLFYLGRLMIYQREAQDKSRVEREALSKQFLVMIRRLLFIITLPGAILTLVLGTCLIVFYTGISSGWLHIKLALLVLLYGYHFSMHAIYRQYKRGIYNYTGYQLRLWNEVPTIFLIAIVFLAVVKQGLSGLYGTLGLIAVTGLLFLGVSLYRRLRKK